MKATPLLHYMLYTTTGAKYEHIYILYEMDRKEKRRDFLQFFKKRRQIRRNDAWWNVSLAVSSSGYICVSNLVVVLHQEPPTATLSWSNHCIYFTLLAIESGSCENANHANEVQTINNDSARLNKTEFYMRLR